MTDAQPTTATTTAGLGPSAQAVLSCSACTHAWVEHDQIAARFCAATMVGHHERGCVCDVVVPVASGAGAR